MYGDKDPVTEIGELSTSGSYTALFGTTGAETLTSHCCDIAADWGARRALVSFVGKDNVSRAHLCDADGCSEVYSTTYPRIRAYGLAGNRALVGLGVYCCYEEQIEAFNTVTKERFLVTTYKIPLYPQTNPQHNFIWFIGDGAITPEGTVYLLSYDVPISLPGKDRMFKITVPGFTAPNISKFEVTPTSIQAGQSATLNWSVLDPTAEISLDQNIGFVAASGSTRVAPESTTTFTLTAKSPGGTLSKQITLTVAPSTGPVVTQVVNAASLEAVPLAPGAWMAIYGVSLGPKAQSSAIVDELAGVGATICGLPAVIDSSSGPMILSNSTVRWQINAIIPDSVSERSSCPLVVTVNGKASAPFDVRMAEDSPALFTFTQLAPRPAGNPIGPDIILPKATHADGSFIGPPAYDLTPARRGEEIILFGTGIYNMPSITIGGVPAQATNIGPSGYPGVIVVNLVVPPNDVGSSGERSLQLGDHLIYSLWVE